MFSRPACLSLTLLIVAASPAYAGFCTQWEKAKAIGRLSVKDLREASGVTASRQFPNRLYWVNDSGDKGYFYTTEPDGKNLAKVKINGFKPRDAEALGMAECPEGPCLAIGDIGDNRSRRKDIKIIFIKEQAQFSEPVKILRELVLEYPDGARDAEAMAFLPNGDLLIVSKELRLLKIDAAPAGVYGLTKTEWMNAGAKKVKLKKLGELPLPTWLREEVFLGQVVTDMAVNTHRQVLGLLTYTTAVEIPLAKLADLKNATAWKKDTDYALLPLEALNQQESMTYLPEPDRVLWSSEYAAPESPIFSMTCTRSAP